VISLSALANLWAESKTNDINIFYNQTWARAWSQCPTDPFYDKNDGTNEAICFVCDDIILARLEIFSYWFMPHPFDNRFQNILLEKESRITELEDTLMFAKKRNRKLFIIGAGLGSIITTGIIITIKNIFK
jgi:hypothetical protein